MDWNIVMQGLSTFGFPIVMCGAMAYYVKYISDKHREEIMHLNDQHKVEVLAMLEEHNKEMVDIVKAVDNNTVALTRLCERLEKV